LIKVIFFDFDGVIVESVDIKTNAFTKLFEQEGEGTVKKIVDYHLNNGGISRYEKFRYIYKEILRRSLDNDGFQRLCSKFADLVVDNVVDAPYVKGAKEFLEKYSSVYKCFVVSATPQEELEKINIRRGINRYFKAVYGAPIKKSDAVREVLLKEGIEPINAVYIGDAMSDYMAAKMNALNFIARVNINDIFFRDINCRKVLDLKGLDRIIEAL
jgi:phosphoglycolate phosphatase-like HAD superfamily hydrolase